MPQHKDLKIFISYRRADNPCFAERIRDWFSLAYERENVFMDFDAIPAFVDFSVYILEQIHKVDVMLAIIGPQWMGILKERIQSGDEDFVRLEIATALKLGKLVAPILIEDTPAPDADELPEDMREMMRFNAARLRGGRQFLDNIEVLIDALPLAIAQNNRLREGVLRDAKMAMMPESVKQANQALESAESLRTFAAETGLAMLPGSMPPGVRMAAEAESADIDESSQPPTPVTERIREAMEDAAPPPAPSFGSQERAEETIVSTNGAKVVIVCTDDDHHTGTRLENDLAAQGYNVTLQTMPDRDFSEDVSVLIVLLSPNSKRSRIVHRLVGVAHNKGVPVLPVLIDGDMDSAVPFIIAANEVSDVRDYDATLPDLLERVAMYTG